MRLLLIIAVFFGYISRINAQNTGYWQQKVKYLMKINMDVSKHQFKGSQHLVYYNNSPDTLKKVYYHLFYNAFQPGSMMDIRNRNLPDPDRNLNESIKNLKPDEIGYEKILIMTQNGKKAKFKIMETILEVNLNTPLVPGDSTELDMIFEVQVPKLCRRAGRNSPQGIDYSMAQWYPKLAEYDHMGWHADQYIGREFYGVWGDFDIVIDIDKRYKIAAGGNLIDKETLNNDMIRYHYKAQNVHDFVWAADRDYTGYSLNTKSGTVFHFYYQNTAQRDSIWHLAGTVIARAFEFMNKRYGKYQYDTYSFIEGGDGGMEYPLATLITGNRSVNSLVGIWSHEFMHSWYQMMLATNESMYPWMDEGFTSFATIEVLDYLNDMGLIDRSFPGFPFENDYNNWNNYLLSPYREPLSTHSDHYNTNYAYWANAYTGGEVFLKQLEYIMGKQAFDQGLLDYFDKWKFKHPSPVDFIRIMEKASGLELDWYLEYFIYAIKYPDYAVDTILIEDEGRSVIKLINKGDFPMPVDIEIVFKDGTKKMYHIPMDMTLGAKIGDYYSYDILPVWYWVNPRYEFSIDEDTENIDKIIIDPSKRMADINRENNIFINTSE